MSKKFKVGDEVTYDDLDYTVITIEPDGTAHLEMNDEPNEPILKKHITEVAKLEFPG